MSPKTFPKQTGSISLNAQLAVARFLALILISTATHFLQAAPDTLIAYWDFNDSTTPRITTDRIRAIEGRLIGKAKFTDDERGHTGESGDRAVDFTDEDGVSYVLVSDGSFLNILEPFDTVTISLWQKLEGGYGSSPFYGISPSSAPDDRGVLAHLPWTDNNIYFDTAGCCDTSTQRIHRDMTSYNSDFDWSRWHHFVFVKNGNTKQIWVDGRLFHTGQNSKAWPGDFSSLHLGASRNGSNHIRGMIDDLAVFASALGADEIRSLRAGESPEKLDLPDLFTGPPSFIEEPEGVSTLELHNVSLRVAFEGEPPLRVIWRKNDTVFREVDPGIDGEDTALIGVGADDDGATITVDVTNALGTITSTPISLNVTAITPSSPTVVWSEDFETETADEWYADNGLWQVGEPSSGPNVARSGSKVAATILSGNYPASASSRWISPRIVVPSAEHFPRFRFSHWFSTASSADFGVVQIRPVGGSWTDVSRTFWYNGGRVWSEMLVDLVDYAGATVEIGFMFSSDCCSHDSGWYIDDLRLIIGSPLLDSKNLEHFESGWGDWYADNGVWEIGTPTTGPGSERRGPGLACTGLNGNYANYSNLSRLISPPLVVPSADQFPRLRFWHWFSTAEAADSGTVQIRTVGGAWADVSTRFWYNGGRVWSETAIDLMDYVGKTIQVGFSFTSNCCGNDSGWYIDAVRMVTGVPLLDPNHFESGWGDWYADNGVWEIGAPTSGPMSAHRGSLLAATTLNDKYLNYSNSSRLISPTFIVPSRDQFPRLRFWHWFSTAESADHGKVQIRNPGGAWTDISGHFWYNGGRVWSEMAIDLTGYADQSVQIGFSFASNCCGNDSGWYFDEFRIVTGAPSLASLEGFENGWGDWSADNGIWEIGTPTSGPGKAHRSRSAAATNLSGAYSNYSNNSRLISPSFLVPPVDQFPRIRFFHWFSSAESEDHGIVQVRSLGGVWNDASTAFWYNGGRVWTETAIDLMEYADQTVQLAFSFASNSSGNDSGWYIDDLRLVTGHPTFPNPEGFELGWGDWYADNGIWEIGHPSRSGPRSAYNGSRLAATGLEGSYPNYANESRLISPFVTIPSVDQFPRLRFWHWFTTASTADKARVQIRPIGSRWIDMSPVYSGSAGANWSQPLIDLSDYGNQTLQIGFLFSSDSGGNEAGWYIDDVRILSDILPRLLDQTITEGNLLTLSVSSGISIQNLHYALTEDCPDGASIDPELGIFTWIPSECHGPGTYPVAVEVTELGNSLAPLASTTFQVIVQEENLRPTPDPIDRQIIHPNTQLKLIVSAFDEDCPEQGLRYSLDADAPAGARIDSGTGEFTWTPTAAQAAATHSITVRVTDDGSPALSSTRTFSAGPDEMPTQPGLAIGRAENEDLELIVSDLRSGWNYTIETSTNLRDWKPFQVFDADADADSETFKLPDPSPEYDLELVSVGTPGDLPSDGVGLVIVAWVNDASLHIRVFDSLGQRAIDRRESELSGDRADEIARLKTRLTPFPDASSLSSVEIAEIRDTVLGLVGDMETRFFRVVVRP